MIKIETRPRPYNCGDAMCGAHDCHACSGSEERAVNTCDICRHIQHVNEYEETDDDEIAMRTCADCGNEYCEDCGTRSKCMSCVTGALE